MNETHIHQEIDKRVQIKKNNKICAYQKHQGNSGNLEKTAKVSCTREKKNWKICTLRKKVEGGGKMGKER